MPSYNVAEFIGEALDSVLNQTFQDFEVIVVNDGSPDTEQLERVLEPYLGRISYIKHETNRGVSAARNAGIRAARGRYLAFLDADDLWEHNYLEVQVGMLEADPDVDVLYPNAVIFGPVPEDGKTYMELSPSEGEVTMESLIRQECTVIASVTARSEIISRSGLFDESLPRCEDFDLWLRVLQVGGRISYHRQPLVRYRRRDGSLSSEREWMYRYAIQVLDKMERTPDLTPAQRQVIAQGRSQFRGSMRLYEGKKAFFRGDIAGAIDGLTEANEHLPSKKVGLVLLLLRLAPGLLLRLYNLRDRLFFQTSTKI
jgi:glycosyltransferase involved in cell wall biosynthesis